MTALTVFISFICIYVIARLFKRKVIDLKGKKVLITGSASGIGRMLAGDMVKKVTLTLHFDK